MLESAACFLAQKKDIKRRDMLSEYRWDFIFSYVKEHEECSRTAVLFSGDIGFYSGAKKLEAALLHSEIDCTVELIPGISSVVYTDGRYEQKNVLSSWRKRCGRTTAERTFGVWNGRTVPFGRKRSFL